MAGGQPKLRSDRNRGNAGKGRPKGVPNKATADIKAVASQYTDEAMTILAKLMRTADSDATKLGAVKEILDRAYGKPKQSVDANVAATFTRIVNEIVDPAIPE